MDDETEPTPCSLEQFVRLCTRLSQSPDETTKNRMFHLLLSGGDEDEKIFIHSNDNIITTDMLKSLTTTRDLDSLIAVSKSLPYYYPLPIYHIPRHSDMLKKDVHITIQVASARRVRNYCSTLSSFLQFTH